MFNPTLRFKKPLQIIEKRLTQASTQKNPGFWLFQHDLRTPFFQMEALGRLYDGVYGKKSFRKLKKRSKLVEDALGKLDYYVGFEKQFKQIPDLPTEFKLYLIHKISACTEELDILLDEENWLNGKRVKKIERKLSEVTWLTEEEESQQFISIFIQEIEAIKTFLHDINNSFHDAETELHEFRRKIRWLSIYAQVLQGQVQLKKDKALSVSLKHYATPAIKQSPFNQLPPLGKCQHPIYMNEACFYALSWMIQELGKLKDACLTTSIVQEASNATGVTLSEKQLKHPFLKNIPMQADFLKTASQVTDRFMNEQVLDYLIIQS